MFCLVSLSVYWQSYWIYTAGSQQRSNILTDSCRPWSSFDLALRLWGHWQNCKSTAVWFSYSASKSNFPLCISIFQRAYSSQHTRFTSCMHFTFWQALIYAFWQFFIGLYVIILRIHWGISIPIVAVNTEPPGHRRCPVTVLRLADRRTESLAKSATPIGITQKQCAVWLGAALLLPMRRQRAAVKISRFCARVWITFNLDPWPTELSTACFTDRRFT
jgi:hypothetical protein